MRIREHPLVERIVYHAAQVRGWARRATGVAVAVRGIVWATGAAAVLLAAPGLLDTGGLLVLAAVLAGLAAGWPASGWVFALEATAMVAVVAAVAGGEMVLLEIGLVAGLLYLHHTTAALAAQVRTDASLPAVVLHYWLVRAAVVLGASVLVGGWVTVLSATEVAWPATILVLAGALATLVVAAVLAYLLRREPESSRAAERALRTDQSSAAPARNSASEPAGSPNGP
jgi:hypothetical protein